MAISERVARWASPGCKDWAEGLAREVEFIENDWRALGWAIGSMRVLLDRRGVQGSSGMTARKPGQAEWGQWSIYASVSFISGGSLITATTLHERVGFCLILIGCAHGVASSIVDWRRNRWEPSTRDVIAYRIFLRDSLQRKLKEYRPVRRCFRLLTNVSMLTGFGLTGWIHWWPISPYTLAAAAAAFLIFLEWGDTPAKIGQRIERMDERIAAANRPAGPQRRVHSEHWGRVESASTMARQIAGSER